MRELAVIKASIATLRDNERTSKELITVLAVETIQRVHEHNDVDTVNSFLLALSEANKRMMLKFAKAFAGHKIGEGLLGKRIKPFEKDGQTTDAYQQAKDVFDGFIDSGMTIWQWAFTEREVEAKPVDIAKIGEQFRKKAKKAMQDGASKLQVFEAATGGLFSAADMLLMLQAMVNAEEAATATLAKAAAPKPDMIQQAAAQA